MNTTFNPSLETQITEEHFNKALETAIKLKAYVSKHQQELFFGIHAELEQKLNSGGKLQFVVPVSCYLENELSRDELSYYFLVHRHIDFLLKKEIEFLDELRGKMMQTFPDYESRLIVYECSSPVLKHSELQEPLAGKDWHEAGIEINEPESLLNLPLSWKIQKEYFDTSAHIYFKFKDGWIEVSNVW